MASSTNRPDRARIARQAGPQRRARWAPSVLFLLAALGLGGLTSAPPAVAAPAKRTVGTASPSATLRRDTAAALAGNREALRRVAKAIVALGPVSIPSASALRPRLRGEAEIGSSAAASAYGILLQYGIGGSASPKEAARWYDRAAAAGNRSGAQRAAVAYALGWGVNRNTAKARKLLSILEPEARAKQMITISEVMLRSSSFEPDLAEDWLERALSLQTRATSKAVTLYERIGDDEARLASVREWLRDRAEKGDVIAAMRLADRLLASSDMTHHEEAARWLLTAADKGNVRAGQRLAMLLAASGSGAPSPVRTYVEMQAKEGSNAARVSLADAFAYAPPAAGGAGNSTENYLAESARSGDSKAQYKLGMLFLNDEGNARSEALARAYLSLAAAKGNVMAKSAVAHLGVMPAKKAKELIDREAASPKS